MEIPVVLAISQQQQANADRRVGTAQSPWLRIDPLGGHATALDLWDVGDVNPTKLHVTLPPAHRPQRTVPKAYVLHREQLMPSETTAIEGVPVVTLERTVRECAADGLGSDILEQAVRNGRARGQLTAKQADMLVRELDLNRVAAPRA